MYGGNKSIAMYENMEKTHTLRPYGMNTAMKVYAILYAYTSCILLGKQKTHIPM